MRKYLALAAAVALLGACDSTDPRVPDAVQLPVESLNLLVGETTDLEAVIVDQRGRAYDAPPTGFEIVWTSSDQTVATVQDGAITGVGSGDATITAQAGTLTPAQVVVSVHGSLDVAGSFDLPVIADDDPDEREVRAEISFTYEGHRSGSVELEETFVLDQLTNTDNFAYTFFNPEFEDQDFIVLQWRPDGTIDYMEFYVDGAVTETGSYTAYLGFLILGFDPESNTPDAEYVLDLHPGTVTVTAADEGQLAGTFSFTMEVDLVTAAASVAGDGAAHSSPRPRRDLRR